MIKKFIFASILVTVLSLSSCSGRGGKGDNDSTPPAVFHADYDIAMIVSSLADAVNVGERLDSADYDFTGVLTDGSGRPLYTNAGGHPGKWHIEVVDTATARIRNTEIGDLMVDDLRNYILNALQLQDKREYLSRDFNGRRQLVYTIPNGFMLFTVTADTTTVDTLDRYVSIVIRH